jgi:hypothetical protein
LTAELTLSLPQPTHALSKPCPTRAPWPFMLRVRGATRFYIKRLKTRASALIVLYSLYGVLQEKILKGHYGADQETFTSSSMLVFSNRVFSCSVGIAILLWKSARKGQSNMTLMQRITPASPIYAYAAVALLNFSSTFCRASRSRRGTALTPVQNTKPSNTSALRECPAVRSRKARTKECRTQALAKTIKMVPVLVMSTLVYKKEHKARQWIAAGIVLLGTATYLTSRPDPHANPAAAGSFLDGLFGTLLLLGYLALDGLTSTTQEKVFGRNPDPTSPFADGSSLATFTLGGAHVLR